MKHMSLELYRWKYHNDIYIHTVNKKRPDFHAIPGQSIISWNTYWVQYGAFVSILPRQSGKTGMIIDMVKSVCSDIEKQNKIFILDLSAGYHMARYKAAGIDTKSISPLFGFHLGIDYKNTCLFVDEFMHITKIDIASLLCNPWKSVSMVSSL